MASFRTTFINTHALKNYLERRRWMFDSPEAFNAWLEQWSTKNEIFVSSTNSVWTYQDLLELV